MNPQLRNLSLVAFAAMAFIGCDQRTDPLDIDDSSAFDRAAHASGESAVLAWNEMARGLVATHATSPPKASRVYALLSVAQHEALQALSDQQPANSTSGALRPAPARAAAVAASAAVLADLYPQQAAALLAARDEQLDALRGSGARHSDDVAPAIALGEQTAAAVLERASSDGSDAEWTGTVPAGPGMWYSSLDPARPPLLPLWGMVRPWFMSSGDEFRPGPPPAFGSPEFVRALAEVRSYSDQRTPGQLQIALFWADGPGTATPPGHWNEIAADLIRRYHLDEQRAARVLAYMNTAVMDAGISCWDAKFEYWLIRPSQADPEITTPVGLPNFPSYTSGHASFSGAASEVLGHYFPAERRRMRSLADEAAMSRVYGGIHYRFDSDRGLEAGQAIGRLATLAEVRGKARGR
jgi:hypothetical protein